MPTNWENSHVDQLSTVYGKKSDVDRAVQEVKLAIEALIGPDAAKILTAIAADVVQGIEARNERPDVRAARTALENAIKLLEAVHPNLQG